jgi:carbonic anhydrase/acetyltransferase-like protein (isoleucine patch superfamily)
METVRPFSGEVPRVHASVFVAGSALVIGDVEIGAQSSVWFGTVVRGDVNSIRIGARTNVQDQSVIHVTGQTHPTVLGDDVTVGHRVTLHGCTIGDRCLIGIGSIVLDGARVEPDSMVGAGALVAPGTVIPSGMLALGAPARVKRPLTPEELARLRDSAERYARLAEAYLREGWTGR